MRTTTLLSLALACLAVNLSGCSYFKTGGGASAGGGGGGGGGSGGGSSTSGGGSTGAPVYSGKVTGTVTYRERIMLPADAIAIVQLVDASKGAVIAEHRVGTMGKAPPYSFTLAYDPSKITESVRYQVRAEIQVRGSARFTTVMPAAVITQGAPANTELVLQAARR